MRRLRKLWEEQKARALRVDPNFGYETIGAAEASLHAYDKSHIHGSPATCPENGIADSITAHLRCQISLEEWDIKAAMYNGDRNFYAETEEKLGQNIAVDPGAWYKFDFPEPKPSINGGEVYPLVVWAGNPLYGGFSLFISGDITKTYEHTAKHDMPYNDWPATIPTPTYGMILSIYCSYTAAPPVVKKPVGDGLTFAI